MIVESYVDGTPSWVDLMTTDQDAAISFYGDLFGWEFSKGNDQVGGYAMAAKDGEPVAGIGAMPESAPFPAAWTTYLSSRDVDGIAEAATEAGGQVMMPAMSISDNGEHVGRMAIIADPTGGVVGVWEPGSHTGARRVNEPGSPIWNELRSTEPATSREFLATVFDHTFAVQESDRDLDYFTVRVDGKDVGGVLAMPSEIAGQVPSHWLAYFAVANTDESVAQAVSSGATVLSPITDTPYGRLATLADPQGAAFAIIQPATG